MTATLWWLVQNSVAVAVLVVLVGCACRLLRNRPAVQHALWLVVLVKFVTPPIVSWPWSARDIGDRIVQLVAPAETYVALSPAGEPRSEDGSRIDNEWRTAALPAISDQLVKPVEPIRASEPMAPSPSAMSETVITLWLLFGLWTTGCVVTLAVQVRRIARHEAVVRRARPAPQPLVSEIAGVARRLGLRPVPALVAQQITTPFVWCLGWLRLIWPEALSSNGDPERCRGIIAHELAHVKRRDYWVAWLELIAGCLWWWNPLFWYVRRQLRETADLACDAQALSAVPGTDRRAYAETFLELTRLISQRQTPAPALGVSTGARRTIERRLSMILNERVKAKTSVASLLSAALLAVAALPAWSLGGDDPTADSTSATQSPGQPAERDASARLRIRPRVPGELDVQTDRGRMSGQEVEVSGDKLVVVGPIKGINAEQPIVPVIEVVGPIKGINAEQKWPGEFVVVGRDRTTTPASPSLAEWRREAAEGVEGRILDFTSKDSPDKQIEEVADALSMGRDSSTALVLNYRLAESQRAALLNFLIGLSASQRDVKVSVVERDLRIVAKPEVHLNLIHLISALRNGTRREPDRNRSGQPAEEEPNDRGATDQSSKVEPGRPYILTPQEPSGLQRFILTPQEPSGLQRFILTLPEPSGLEPHILKPKESNDVELRGLYLNEENFDIHSDADGVHGGTRSPVEHLEGKRSSHVKRVAEDIESGANFR